MALSTKVGTFTLRTDTSANAVTGVGFQPVAVIFWGGRETADGSFDDVQFCVGAATGATQRWCGLMKSEDAANPAYSAGMMFNNKCFAVYNSSGSSARDAEVDFTSLDADGFTVTNTTAPGTAYRVNYLALGGADLTAAFAGSRTITTGTGSLATTGVGFQGDTMFAVCTNSTAFGTSAGGSGLGIGAATSSTARWAMLALSENNVATSDTRARIATNRVGVVADNTFDGNSLSLDFTSWDADGFTLSKADHASGATECFGYLVLQGADAAVGTFTTQTGTGAFSTTGLAFKPSALLAAGTMVATATETAPSAHAEMAFGVTDGTTQIAYWSGDVDAVAAPVDNKRRVDSTKFLVNNDRSTPFAAEGEIGFTSFNSDGFTLNQTDADGSAFLVGYLALGPGAASTDVLIQGLHGIDRGMISQTAARLGGILQG